MLGLELVTLPKLNRFSSLKWRQQFKWLTKHYYLLHRKVYYICLRSNEFQRKVTITVFQSDFSFFFFSFFKKYFSAIKFTCKKLIPHTENTLKQPKDTHSSPQIDKNTFHKVINTKRVSKQNTNPQQQSFRYSKMIILMLRQIHGLKIYYSTF